RLTETKLGPGSRILHAQPGIFVSELNAIANSEIDVEIGRVGNGLIAVEKGHVAEINFPIEVARGARIVGVVGRAALGKCRGQQRKKDEAPQPSARAKRWKEE